MFQGCQRIVEDWQKILMVRSLVVSPHEDMRTWLKYASLCGKSGRLVSDPCTGCGGRPGRERRSWSRPVYNPACLVFKALAHKTLVLLLGVDPSRQLDHPLPTVHPQVTYAYMKNMWKSARKVCIQTHAAADRSSRAPTTQPLAASGPKGEQHPKRHAGFCSC